MNVKSAATNLISHLAHVLVKCNEAVKFETVTETPDWAHTPMQKETTNITQIDAAYQTWYWIWRLSALALVERF